MYGPGVRYAHHAGPDMVSMYIRLYHALPALTHGEGGMKKAWMVELASVIVLAVVIALIG